MITIAVDAMGGDHAPRPEVEGSVLAAREFGVRVLLVGQPAEIKRELARHSQRGLSIEVVPASEVITMSDSPDAGVSQEEGQLGARGRAPGARRARPTRW